MKKIFTLIVFCLVIGGVSAQVSFVSDNKSDDSFVTELNIYPNPTTTGNITININLDRQEETVTIKVYNLIGKTVFVQKINSFETELQEVINLSSNPKGVYILEVSNGEKKEIRRLSFV